MTQDDVLLGYRLQLFRLAGELGVSAACRLMGVHRSTYYRWKGQVDRSGLVDAGDCFRLPLFAPALVANGIPVFVHTSRLAPDARDARSQAKAQAGMVGLTRPASRAYGRPRRWRADEP